MTVPIVSKTEQKRTLPKGAKQPAAPVAHQAGERNDTLQIVRLTANELGEISERLQSLYDLTIIFEWHGNHVWNLASAVATIMQELNGRVQHAGDTLLEAVGKLEKGAGNEA